MHLLHLHCTHRAVRSSTWQRFGSLCSSSGVARHLPAFHSVGSPRLPTAWFFLVLPSSTFCFSFLSVCLLSLLPVCGSGYMFFSILRILLWYRCITTSLPFLPSYYTAVPVPASLHARTRAAHHARHAHAPLAHRACAHTRNNTRGARCGALHDARRARARARTRNAHVKIMAARTRARTRAFLLCARTRVCALRICRGAHAY